MSRSTYLRNKDPDIWYGKIFAPTIPATIYLQLHTGNPGAAGTSNVHPNIGRLAVPNDATNWPAASGGVKTNGLKLNFGDTTGNPTWPDATYVSIWDSAAGGNMWDFGQFASPLVVGDRVEVSILAGALTITRPA